MLRFMLLLAVCPLACALPHVKPDENHALHHTYSRSLKLALQIHRDVRGLLPQYEEQLHIQDVHVSNLFMKSLPSCAYNYTDWLSLEEVTRLQQDGWVLQVFGLHLDDCCSSELQLETEAHGQLSQALEELQLNIRDLNVQIAQQLESLHHPAAASLPSFPPASLCGPQSLWVGRIRGYIVLRGLETCLRKVVRDYTVMRSQRQQ